MQKQDTPAIELTDGPLTDFELYYTKNGLVQVSNDVRRRILHELAEKDLSLTDLSRITGKAQSTLSVHLDKMVSEALISAHDDPEDSRRKVYSLVSVMLAHSKPPSEEALTKAMNVLTDVVDDVFVFSHGTGEIPAPRATGTLGASFESAPHTAGGTPSLAGGGSGGVAQAGSGTR